MTREGSVRVHVVMPKELVEQIDALVGKRRRSEFIVEAVRDHLARRRRSELDEHGRRRSEMGRKVAGSLADVDIPGWESSDAAAEWVRQQRYGGDVSNPAGAPSDP